jgi:hypothetical protein
MLKFVMSLVRWFGAFLPTRRCLGPEILYLRQQMSVLPRKHPRPRLSPWYQVLWVFLRRVWCRWAEVVVAVKLETVVRWHRAGFRLKGRWLSRRSVEGRPKISAKVGHLVQRVAKENPLWGAPRIHGELLKLGFDVSERSVSRYLFRRAGRKSWRSTRKENNPFPSSVRPFVSSADGFWTTTRKNVKPYLTD